MSLSNPKRKLQLTVAQQPQKNFNKIVEKMSENLRVITKSKAVNDRFVIET